MEKRLKTQVEKVVAEVNSLIQKAYDSDGDRLQVVIDKTSTVEIEETIISVRFVNNHLTVVIADWLGKERKEDYNASSMEYDGLPYLRMIKRALTAGIKKQLN